MACKEHHVTVHLPGLTALQNFIFPLQGIRDPPYVWKREIFIWKVLRRGILISELKWLSIWLTDGFMNFPLTPFHDSPSQEEQRKIEEENEKKKENEMVFKAWLQKKREQVIEMRRVQRAKQIEDMNSRVSDVPCETHVRSGRESGGGAGGPSLVQQKVPCARTAPSFPQSLAEVRWF